MAAISGWISRGEGDLRASAYAADWVRTADGWESRRVLEPFEPAAAPPVHPAVIAGFQLMASLFFLAAFPARATVGAVRNSESLLRTHVRTGTRVAAAG